MPVSVMDNRPAYTWRLTLDDGSVIEQYDELGEEVLFGSVDLTRVRSASWVPIRHLKGEVADSATYFTVLVGPGQTPILRRRHRVIGDRDTVIMYILGVRDEEGVLGEHHIDPEPAPAVLRGGVLRYERPGPSSAAGVVR